MASVKKLGEGRAARYRVKYRTADEKSRSQVFDRLADAKAFAVKVENARKSGTLVDPVRSKVTFGEWADLWLTFPHDTRRTTRARDESYLRNIVRPAFARRQLKDIRRGDVQNWIHALGEAGYAPATTAKAVQISAKIFDAAILEERLAVNPARGVKLPKVPDVEARFLTPAELLSLEAAMPEQYAVLVPFVADVGLRIGEVAGLRWKDVDTWAGTVTVREVLTEVHGVVYLGEPKTRAGRRTVPTLTREVGARLEEHRGAPEDFVFSSPQGGPLRPTLFRSRVWRPTMAGAGLATPTPTPHSLRHSAVAHWIAAGVESYKLAKWAGHRSVATIYRVYGHLLNDDATEERAALSAIRASAIEEKSERGVVLALHDGGAFGARQGRSPMSGRDSTL